LSHSLQLPGAVKKIKGTPIQCWNYSRCSSPSPGLWAWRQSTTNVCYAWLARC